MKLKNLLLLIPLWGLSLVSCSPDPVDTTGNVSGIVTDVETSKLLAGVNVTLSPGGRSVNTGNDGRYEFRDIEMGAYTLQAQALGYQTTTKQVTVNAKETTTSDFQLSPEKIVVEITPMTLTFGKEVDNLSFSLSNKSRRDLTYSISNSHDYLEVTPASGTVKSNATQTIGVRVKNRNTVRDNLNGQLIVTVGNDSYSISVAVLGINETATTGGIAGKICDYANANMPISGAMVSLTSTGQTKTTGTDGYYEFSELAAGTYTLLVSANGYESLSKDVKVEVGVTTPCDIALQKGGADVVVTPENLSFSPEVEQLSFSIRNNNLVSHEFMISNVPDFATVSQSSGVVSAKGSQVVTVTILNRKNITSARSGQMIVSVGNESYIVSLSVEAYKQEPVNVEVTPQALVFDANTSQLNFSVESKTNRMLNYSISTAMDDITVSPAEGTLGALAKKAINVTVNNRESIKTERNGMITITIEENTYNVSVKIKKIEDNPGPGPDDPTPSGENVTRGLLAYYTFDNSNANDSRGNYNGFKNGGSFITDTPNGSGKALSLKSNQYISIGYAPLNEKKTYTFSMWVKDFGTGCLFKTLGGSYLYGPSLVITEAMKLQYHTGYGPAYSSVVFNTDLSNFQSGEWTMLTIVTETPPSMSSSTNGTSTLYINGQRAESGSSRTSDNKNGISMTIGGQAGGSNAAWADPMKVDNVRIYSVALTDDEVASIYQYESASNQ